jgi:hypothetical protein
MIHSVQAHSAAIYGMDLTRKQGRTLHAAPKETSISGDVMMKQIETGPGSRLVTRRGEERVPSSRQRGLSMLDVEEPDDILAVKHWRGVGRLVIRLSKLSFQDTLKSFLSLYNLKVGSRADSPICCLIRS